MFDFIKEYKGCDGIWIVLTQQTQIVNKQTNKHDFNWHVTQTWTPTTPIHWCLRHGRSHHPFVFTPWTVERHRPLFSSCILFLFEGPAQPRLFDATGVGYNLQFEVWARIVPTTTKSVLCDRLGIEPPMRGSSVDCPYYSLPQPRLFYVTGLGSSLRCEVGAWIVPTTTHHNHVCSMWQAWDLASDARLDRGLSLLLPTTTMSVLWDRHGIYPLMRGSSVECP